MLFINFKMTDFNHDSVTYVNILQINEIYSEKF